MLLSASKRCLFLMPSWSSGMPLQDGLGNNHFLVPLAGLHIVVVVVVGWEGEGMLPCM